MSTRELDESLFDRTAGSVVEAGAAPTHVRYWVLASACGLAIVTYVHRMGFATACTQLREPLGLNDQHIGYLMSVFMVAYGLFEVPWGRLGDRFGARHLLAIIVLGGSLTTGAVVLVLFLPNELVWVLGFLLVLRFLFGMFQAGTFPVISRMLTDWMPITERGRAQGLLWMSTRIGGAVAPLVLVALFKNLGLWPPLVIASGLGLLWCAIFWPWFRNRPEDMPAVSAKERAIISAGRVVKAAPAHGPAPWGRIARSLSVWSLCLMYGSMGFSSNFYLTLLPTYLKGHRNLSDEASGLLTSLPFACGVLACLVGGALSDLIIKRTGTRRWGRRIVGLCGLLIAAVACVSIPWVKSPWLLAVILCITFSGNDLAMGPAWAAVADIGERYAGTVGGTMNMINSLLGAVSAIIIGKLLHNNDLTSPFLIFATSYIVGALCWLGVDVTKTVAQDDRADLDLK